MPGLSLWLSPSPESTIYASLEMLIANLSDKFYSGHAPKFVPHITITSGIPFDTNAESVVAYAASILTESIELTILKIDYGPAYFKKIFLRVEKTSGLTKLARESRRKYVLQQTLDNEAAEKEAIKWEIEDYDPHISLVYTEEWPVHDQKRLLVEKTVEANLKESSTSWTGGRLSLYETIGPADQWKLKAYKDL
ncbi:2',3'-cyclic-nucleotide 3'-phosphodiesterase [Lipomyces japonicus]|uniref:2',3'-cyclic-nucleotide 3'-phosphodiesterase n=1 Tax=Lipomyces japonicus TaxID=56871 RepID=UPI0034CE1F40